MDPNGQYQNNKYDFILNPGEQPKKSILPGPGASKAQRILVVVIAGALLLVVILTIFALLAGGGSRKDVLISLAKQQVEIARISKEGQENARSSDTRAFVATTNATLNTIQADTVAILSGIGVKPNDKQLLPVPDTETDAALTSAQQQNRYDEALRQILDTKLTKYQSDLKAAFDSSKSTGEKNLLSESYAKVSLLLATGLER